MTLRGRRIAVLKFFRKLVFRQSTNLGVFAEDRRSGDQTAPVTALEAGCVGDGSWAM
ncbi:MAG: hypothetical protein NZ585_04815 [Chloracidobacterium sp.]|nr:hypothetical protein [Chloracidobacterium sp.]MDW8216805.1 hypothetical protein [Acidobacteriota bacterium]